MTSKILGKTFKYNLINQPAEFFLKKPPFAMNDTYTYLYRQYIDIRIELMEEIKKEHCEIFYYINPKEIQRFNRELTELTIEVGRLNYDCFPSDPNKLMTDEPLILAKKFH